MLNKFSEYATMLAGERRLSVAEICNLIYRRWEVKYFRKILSLVATMLVFAILLGVYPLVEVKANQAGEATVQDSHATAEEVARKFIEFSLAKRGPLLLSDDYATDTEPLQEFLNMRRQAILERREGMGCNVLKFEIDLKKTASYAEEDRIVYYFRSYESTTYSYPAVTSGVKGIYVVELVREADSWKISGALSVDEYYYVTISWSELNALEQTIRKRGLARGEIQRVLADVDCDYWEAAFRRGLERSKNDFSAVPTTGSEVSSRVSFYRTGMKRYQRIWALNRNPAWGDFSNLGGDCQNFASQVIYAGGAPMDEVGSYKWYYYGSGNRAPSWTGVYWMKLYILNNAGKGPHGILYSSISYLYCGDMVMFDWDGDGSYDHTAVIYSPGNSPTLSAHTQDMLDEPLSSFGSAQSYVYIHLSDFGS